MTPSVVEEAGVGVDHVAAGVEPEDLQLGLHPLLGRHLGQPGHLALAGLVAEVEGELDRGDRRGGGVARDWAAALAHTPVGQRVPLSAAGSGPRVGAVAGAGARRPGPRADGRAGARQPATPPGAVDAGRGGRARPPAAAGRDG